MSAVLTVSKRGIAAIATVLLSGCALDRGTAPRIEQFDDYHGDRVADPYRWLETTDSAPTQAWILAQNRRTENHIRSTGQRNWFAQRLRRLIDYERVGIPQHANGVFVYERNSGLDEQDAIWVSDQPGLGGRILLDPNRWQQDGSVSVSNFRLSPGGRYLAYGLSDGGSDWRRWRIRDTGSGEDLPETLVGIKFSTVAWLPDDSGFFYSRYPLVNGKYDDGSQVRIWFHTVATPQSEDRPVYSVEDHPRRNPYAEVTDDGRFLIIDLFDGYQANGVYYQRLAAGRPVGPVIRLIDSWDAEYNFLGTDGDRFLFHTTHDALRGRVVAIDIAKPEPSMWQEVVAQRSAAIDAASSAGRLLFIRYIEDVHTEVDVYPIDGGPARRLALPGNGSVEGFYGRADDRFAYYSYADYRTPTTLYRYDFASAGNTAVHRPSAGFDPEFYTQRQVFVSSRDGTSIPITIIAPRSVRAGNPRPAVLYGYGGFGVSLLPRYSTARMAWLQAGGIFVVANLRGGGEYGKAWHRAGIKDSKQNVFDDFIAVADWLIENEYTSARQLAIWGGSNGGLLVGAVSNQRPQLFAAAVPSVGVMDMLRYQLASANARQWSSDYGLSENADDYPVLRAYSPYHNVRKGQCYPATLVMADANDDRVAPWHSYKYAAELQQAQGCNRPVLIRIDTQTGHGAGAAVSKVIDEFADQWAFVADATGLRPGAPD